jgi:hypothetical protein
VVSKNGHVVRCRALNGAARRRHLWVRAVRKITNQRSAALLESLTSETKLTPALQQPGASDSAPPAASEPTDDVTLTKVSVASGKPDDDTSVAQTGNTSLPQHGDFLSPDTFKAVGSIELSVKMTSYTKDQERFLVKIFYSSFVGWQA